MMDVWDAALRAVVGVILAHPGVSEVRKDPNNLLTGDVGTHLTVG